MKCLVHFLYQCHFATAVVFYWFFKKSWFFGFTHRNDSENIQTAPDEEMSLTLQRKFINAYEIKKKRGTSNCRWSTKNISIICGIIFIVLVIILIAYFAIRKSNSQISDDIPSTTIKPIISKSTTKLASRYTSDSLNHFVFPLYTKFTENISYYNCLEKYCLFQIDI